MFLTSFLYFLSVDCLQVNVDVLKIKNDFKFTCKWYRDWVMYDDYGEYSLSKSLKMIFGKTYSKNRI